MRVETREQYQARHEGYARDAYKSHCIRKESEGRWLIMARDKNDPERWEGAFWTEIVCTWGQGMYVDGDIEPSVFRYGPDDFLARIGWMARREHAWDPYFIQKAAIAMGGNAAVMEWRLGVARGDLQELVAEIRQSYDDDFPLPESEARRISKLEEILGDLHDETTRDDVCRSLYEIGLWEDCQRIGMVPDTRLFYAHAALQRLYHLLRERGDYDEPVTASE